LVGLIACSDAFGVDLIIDRYNDAIAANAKLAAQKQEAFMTSDPEELEKNGAPLEMKSMHFNKSQK